MELWDYIRTLRKNWWILLILTVIGGGGALLFTITRTPLYSSTSKVFVSISNASNIADLQQGSTFADNRIASYTALATTPVVLNPVIHNLGLSVTAATLAKSIVASNPLNTTLVQIVATDPLPARAAAIANTVATQLTLMVEQMETPNGSRISPVKLSHVQTGIPSATPSSPRLVLNLVVGVLIGFLAGLVTALLRQALDTKIRSADDVVRLRDNIAVLGTITFDKQVRKQPLIVHDSPQSSRSEQFRSLRTNVGFLGAEGPRSFVVTSSLINEGKSTTVVNLAITLSHAGYRVALVDADLRNPTVARYLGIEGNGGLTDVLRARASIEDVIQQWGDGPLWVMPAGRIPPNPSELLGSRRMSEILTMLEGHYDYVLFDTPPLLAVTDAALLASRTAGTIVVVHAGRTRRGAIDGAFSALEKVEARVSGVVLSMVHRRAQESYYYGRYYGYPATKRDRHH